HVKTPKKVQRVPFAPSIGLYFQRHMNICCVFMFVIQITSATNFKIASEKEENKPEERVTVAVPSNAQVSFFNFLDQGEALSNICKDLHFLVRDIDGENVGLMASIMRINATFIGLVDNRLDPVDPFITEPLHAPGDGSFVESTTSFSLGDKVMSQDFFEPIVFKSKDGGSDHIKVTEEDP
ncbi:hypothetical protein ACJX0J_008270, partial [Zea mays]